MILVYGVVMRWLSAVGLAGSLVFGNIYAQDGVPVRAILPQAQGLSEELILSGSLTAQHNANLSSRTAGLVSELLVDTGSQVSKGQPLLKLDTALAQHELAQRRAAYEAAQSLQIEQLRLVKEAEELTAQHLFPQTELAIRQAALAGAAASLQQAKANLAQQQEVLERHTLTAPFSGVIAQRHTDMGEWVALGSPVLQLVSVAPLLLDVQVPQEYFATLPNLARIDVRADMLPGITLEAQLLSTVPVGDSRARSFLARVEITDEQHTLLPGTSASAIFHFKRANNSVLIVPPDALLRHPDGSFSVFAVRDNNAYRFNVRLGRSSEQGVEVLSGLPTGLPVVIRGNEILRDGQAVYLLADEQSGKVEG